MKKLSTTCCYFLSLGLLLPATGLFAQSPGGVTGNNTVWLKANAGTTLNAMNNVTQWNEVSGAAVTGNFTTANGLANQQPPLLQNAGLNFNPNIVFVSTAPNSLISANSFPGGNILNGYNNTLIQVIKLHTMTNTGVWLKWQFSNTSPSRLGNEVNNGGANTGRMRFDFRNGGNNLFSTTVIAEKNIIATAATNQATNSLRLNGATDATQSVASAAQFLPGTTPGRFSLGNEWTGDAYPTTVDIAEVILYSRTLTNAERNKVESYLAVKYGFTLAQTGTDANDYTSSAGTVTWDRVANTTYINNITGIGRDDNSALDQRQSLSINPRAMVTIYHGSVTGTFPATNVANTNAFGADQDFLLFGDNQADTLVKLCSADGSYARMARTWKAQVTGNPGVVTLSLKKANVPPEITSLLVSNDPTFATGVTHTPIQDNGTELYAAVTLGNNQYFTFGTTPLVLNGQVSPIVCAGNNGSVTLNPTGGTAPLTYSWNSTPPQTTQNLTGVAPGTYTVTVSQGNGCSFSQTYAITGNTVPILVTVTDTVNTVCTTKNGSITVFGSGGTPSYLYNIDNSPTWTSLKTFDGLAPGAHLIKIKDRNNCEEDTTVTLSTYTYKLNVEAETMDAWCDAGGLAGEVKVMPSGGSTPYSYFWNGLSTGKGPRMSNLPKGDYKVTVTDRFGCTGDVTAEVKENFCCAIGVPNAFTPNNDGLNDEFKAVINRPIPKFEMSVFNRWGRRVFYSPSATKGWDGNTDGGTPMDGGVYFYRIRYTCEMGNQEKVYQGDLTLIR